MSHLTCRLSRLLLHYLGKCNSDSSLTFSSISDEAVNVSNMSVNIHRRWLLSVVDCVCVNETSSQCHSSSSSSACHWQHYQWCWCCWCWWKGISSQCHCWQEIIIMWKRTTIIIIIRGQTAAAAAVDWERRQQSTELQACETVLNVTSAHTTLLWDRPLCVRLWKTDTHYETLLNKRCFYSLNVHLYVRACRSLCYLLPVNKRWNWICIQHVLHASADMKYDKIQWNNKYTQRRQLTDQFLLDNITHAAGPYS